MPFISRHWSGCRSDTTGLLSENCGIITLYDFSNFPTTNLFGGFYLSSNAFRRRLTQLEPKQGERKMKTQLILAGILTSIIIQPAHAVTKCVALNSNTTCTYKKPGDNVAGWTSTCTTNGVNTPISGIGICSSTTGESYGETATELDISSTADNNTYCWCKMTSPAVSRWVSPNSYTPADVCAMQCASTCASAVRNSAAFRSALFSNLSD